MYQKGNIVWVPFPYVEGSGGKNRPAIVLSIPTSTEVVLCQVTSTEQIDEWAVHILPSDLATGRLANESFIRPNRIFTRPIENMQKPSGDLGAPKLNELSLKLRKMFAL